MTNLPIIFFILHFVYSHGEASLQFLRQPSNETVFEGETVRLRCHFRGLKNGNPVSWNIRGFVYLVENIPKYIPGAEIDNSSEGLYDLIIRNVSIENDGQYSCQARGEKPLKSRTVYIRVKVPPKHIEMKLDPVKVNNKVTVTCLIKDVRPPPHITWKLDEDIAQRPVEEIEVGSSSKLKTVRSTISFKALKQFNKKNILCYSSSKEYPKMVQVSKNLVVLYPPEDPPSIRFNPQGRLIEGQLVEMICSSLSGNPLPSLTWSIAGVELPATSVKQFNNSSISILRHQVKFSDNGKLVECSATNVALQPARLTTKQSLHVLYPPKDMTLKQDSPEGVEINGSISLTCLTKKSEPPAQIRWLKNHVPLYSSDGRHQIPGNHQQYQSILSIKSLRIADTKDIFTCIAEIPELQFSRQISTKLNVLYPPHSIAIKTTGSVSSTFHRDSKITSMMQAGQILQLNCVVEGGNPEPDIQWMRDRIPILSDDTKISISKCEDDQHYCSQITKVLEPADNGSQFACVAGSNNVELQDTIVLKVSYLPERINLTQIPPAPLSGQNTNIIADVSDGYPTPNITWFINERPVSTPNLHVSTNTLFLTPNHTYDKAKITCRVGNGLNSKNETIFLNVRYEPVVKESLIEAVAIKGNESLLVHLPVSANPPLTSCGLSKMESLLNNLKEKKSKVVHSRLKWSNNCTILEIVNPQKTDAGLYQVRVGNGLGTSTMSVQVDVQYAPEIIQLEAPKQAKTGDDIRLKCVVVANPMDTLQISWFKSGNRITNNLKTENGTSVLLLKNVTREHRGIYACKADNGIKGKYTKKQVDVKLKFEPIIVSEKTPSKVAFLGGKQKLIKITCAAMSNPEARFQWESLTRNESRSLHTITPTEVPTKLEGDIYESVAEVAFLSKEPFPENGLRFVCIAINTFATVRKIIHVVNPGRPDPPTNVSILNISENSVEISWKAGFNGGVAQNFQILYAMLQTSLDGKEEMSHWMCLNTTMGQTRYTLRGLQYNAKYLLVTRAINRFGHSEATEQLQVQTLRMEVVEHMVQAKKRQPDDKENPMFIIVILTAVCFFLGGVVFILTLCFWKNEKFCFVSSEDKRKSEGSGVGSIRELGMQKHLYSSSSANTYVDCPSRETRDSGLSMESDNTCGREKIHNSDIQRNEIDVGNYWQPDAHHPESGLRVLNIGENKPDILVNHPQRMMPYPCDENSQTMRFLDSIPLDGRYDQPMFSPDSCDPRYYTFCTSSHQASPLDPRSVRQETPGYGSLNRMHLNRGNHNHSVLDGGFHPFDSRNYERIEGDQDFPPYNNDCSQQLQQGDGQLGYLRKVCSSHQIVQHGESPACYRNPCSSVSSTKSAALFEDFDSRNKEYTVTRSCSGLKSPTIQEENEINCLYEAENHCTSPLHACHEIPINSSSPRLTPTSPFPPNDQQELNHFTETEQTYQMDHNFLSLKPRNFVAYNPERIGSSSKLLENDIKNVNGDIELYV